MYDDVFRGDRLSLTRRGMLGMGAAFASLPLLEACGAAGGGGKALVVGIAEDPTSLTSATNSTGIAQFISPKMFDGLLRYSNDLKPLPRLAREWQFSPDDRALTLKLAPGVRWHDGKDFTSGDIAFSALNIWKVYHSRGRMTYANLEAVDTPDPLTVIFRFSKPAPYVLSALAASESQVVPRHLYEGRDILTNPANLKPVGTGPFRFAEWQRGQFIRLERNPDYWQKGEPYLDGVIFRIIGDGAAQAAALEAGDIQFSNTVAIGDYERLAKLPSLRHDSRTSPLVTSGVGLEFNLDVPKLQDVRVRRAIAHAIDKDYILKTVLHGAGVIDDSPISKIYPAFHTDDVPKYPFDPARAVALLDEAGLKPDAKGVRLHLRLAPSPTGNGIDEAGQYFRSALGKVGIAVQIESQDFATFVKRVYTARDFEAIIVTGQMGPDPVIGTQRWYWSKSFKPGVAFSNGAHYANPEVDRLLEAAASEVDPVKRRDLYAQFQRVVMTDLPRVPLWSSSGWLFTSARLSALPDGAEGAYGSFGGLTLAG